MKERILLVFSPIDKKYQDAKSHFAPPLGLIALKNYVEERHHDEVVITILDGSVLHTVDDACAFIDKEKPDIVAQSIQLISYSNALTIAKHARQNGALNVLGGQHASQLSDFIALRQEGLIDYVVTGDGEESLLGIIEERNIEDIPNLVYTLDGKIHKTNYFSLNLAQCSPVDYSSVDFTPYQKLLHNEAFSDPFPLNNYLRIYSHKGCGNRGNSVGCVFCGRADKGVRFKTPKQFWNDMYQVIEMHHADYVFDVGDDFLNDSNWVKDVAASKPDFDAPYDLGIFGRANRVTPDVAHALGIIGVSDVVIGFESGNADVLRICNKRNTTPDINIQASKYLFSEGIDICASFVLGLPGENARTLQDTFDCAATIVDLAVKLMGRPPREMVANLLEPSPGSPAYQKILAMMPEKYCNNDMLSLEELQRDYFKCYFGLESERDYQNFRQMLCEAAHEIHNLVSYSDPQGWLSDEEIYQDKLLVA